MKTLYLSLLFLLASLTLLYVFSNGGFPLHEEEDTRITYTEKTSIIRMESEQQQVKSSSGLHSSKRSTIEDESKSKPFHAEPSRMATSASINVVPSLPKVFPSVSTMPAEVARETINTKISKDYRTTQFAATPFPTTYESSLVRTARKLGVDIPDIYKRHRKDGGGFNECPPHDMDIRGVRKAATELAKKAGNSYNTLSLASPDHSSIGMLTLGLVIVSFDAPETLRFTINSYKEGGMLDLFDDRVAFLNAAQQEEIDIALEAGFRVYTPDPVEVAQLLSRHRNWLSQFDHLDASKLFPATRLVNGRYATYVAPSQIMSYLEMSTDIVLFAEKDYVLKSGPQEQTVRSLLAAVAMLQSGTNVVRLRRIDDENRDAITDCCHTGECGNSFSNFQGESCRWESQLNWLAIFCDTDNIETRSKGRVKQCMAENDEDEVQAGNVSVERMGSFCFSFDDSNWSNNVAMFGREWWITALGHGAVLTEGDNGIFELNMVQLCGLLPKIGMGAGQDRQDRGRICQLQPGMFVHRELGKEKHNVRGERN
jgi:hypothetical protein